MYVPNRNNRVHVIGEKNAYRLLYDSPVQTSIRTLNYTSSMKKETQIF